MSIINWIIMILICFILLYTWILLSNISEWFKEKTTNLKIINNREMMRSTKDTFRNRLNSSLDLLELCGTMIDNEISKTITNCLILNSRYDLTRIDSESKYIADKVFNDIKKETFIEDDLLLSPECFLQYITDETICRLLLTAKNYNDNYSINM